MDESNKDNIQVKIKIQCFVFKKSLFMLETYEDLNLRILVKKKGKDDCCDDIEHLPEFMQPLVQKVVTNDKDYFTYNLSKSHKNE